MLFCTVALKFVKVVNEYAFGSLNCYEYEYARGIIIF